MYLCGAKRGGDDRSSPFGRNQVAEFASNKGCLHRNAFKSRSTSPPAPSSPPPRSEDSSNPSHPLMPLTNERDRKVGDSDPTTFIPCVHLGVCARFFSLRCKYRKTVRGRERKPSSFSSPLFDICRVLLHQIFFFSFFFAKPLLEI